MPRKPKVRPRPELRLRLHPSERSWHRQFVRQAIREYGSVSACLRAKLGIPGPGFSDAVGEALRWVAATGTTGQGSEFSFASYTPPKIPTHVQEPTDAAQ